MKTNDSPANLGVTKTRGQWTDHLPIPMIVYNLDEVVRVWAFPEMIDLPEGTSSSCLLLEMKHRNGESPANDGFISYGANVAPWKNGMSLSFFLNWGWILLYESANQWKRWKKDRKRDICSFSVLQSLVGGIPTPLNNDGFRQLEWWHSQYMGSLKIPWFQSPPTTYSYRNSI